MKKKVKAVESECSLPIFKDTLRIEIDGLNQPRLISALKNEGICLTNIRLKSSKVMQVDLSKNDSKKAIAIFEKLCYNYSVLDSSGARKTLAQISKRCGLIVGVLIFSTLIGLSRGFIWKVELSGCENIPQQSVYNFLKDQDIAIGKKLSGVDKIQLKNLLNSLDGVLESTVEIVGTTVKIGIIENTDFVNFPDGEIKDILSNYDAEITKIVTHQGTALVARGQRVFKGTPLIGAYRVNQNEEKLPIAAKGEVYGNVMITKSVTFAASEYKVRRTGKTYKSTVLKLFGLQIGKPKNPFEQWESEKKDMYAFENTFLPIIASSETFYETTCELIQHDVGAKAEEIRTQAVLDNVINCGGSEISTTTTLNQISENIYKLNIFMQAEMKLNG